ncbi:MAG: DMT family transporter, partial [Proteobacteria bacterium]|nr:DMT family transporter [Pseudomonadota bacterium]
MAIVGQAARRDQVPRAIALMIGSSLVFSLANALVKWEVELYPVGEVAFFRTAFGLIPLYLIILPRAGLAVFRTRRPGAHVKRAVSQFGSMTCFMLALQVMPLADVTAIGFTAPLFTTLLSIVILKDRVGIHRWGALIAGFLGVLLITHPGPGTFQIGVAFGLANAVLISTVAIAIRQMSVTESTETLTIWQMTLIALLTACLLPFGFTVPSWTDLGLLALAGFGNGTAQYWWTKALHLAPPSAITPFNYLSLIWAALIGFAVWGDLPTRDLIIGAVIVV